MPAQQESVTLTFIFTDLVGSTDLLQRLGEEKARRVFERHHEQLANAVSQHGGEELEWLGDGMVAAFPSSVQAIRCAVAMQRTTRRPVAGQQLGMRIGINTGEAMRRSGGYFGNTVVIARRLCDTAQPGQILTTGMVASMLAGRQSFGFRELGTLELKGIAQPVAVVEVTATARKASEAMAAAPAIPAAPPVPARRRPLLLAGAAGVAVIVLVGVAALAGGLLGPAAETSPSPAPGGVGRAVVQLVPMIAWHDAASGELRYEAVGWASGTVVDERGLILTSRAAIDPASYDDPFDVIGVAFGDTNGRSARVSHLAQRIAVGEGGSELAVLMITGTADGAPADALFPSADPGDPAGVTRGQMLELVGFPTGPEVPFGAPQTLRASEARDFAQVGGRLDLIESGAQLSNGEHGGGAFADGRLVGVLVASPTGGGTAAVRPVSLADQIIQRGQQMLDAQAEAPAPVVQLEPARGPLPDPTFEFTVRATVSGMADGALWSWSCTSPSGQQEAAAWPPRLAWNAGSGAVELDLTCRSESGFALEPGAHSVTISGPGASDGMNVLAQTQVTVAAPAVGGERVWRSAGVAPDFEVTIGSDFACASCDGPYLLARRLVLDLLDPGTERPPGVRGPGQMSIASLADTEWASSDLAALSAALVGPGATIIAGPAETTIDGRPALAVELTYSQDFAGSGPFAGAQFLAGTRGRWTFVAADGVNLVVGGETWDGPGSEQRLALMDAVARSLRFR